MKIIQLLLTTNNNLWQGSLLGLGDDGIVYRHDEHFDGWVVFIPANFIQLEMPE